MFDSAFLFIDDTEYQRAVSEKIKCGPLGSTLGYVGRSQFIVI